MKKRHYLYVFLIAVGASALCSFSINALRNHRSVESVAELGSTSVPNGSYVTVPSNPADFSQPARLYSYCDTCTGTTDGLNSIWSTTAPTSSGRYRLTNWLQPQANWTQSNSAALDFIKNKPTVPTAQAWYNGAGVISTPTKMQVMSVAASGSGNGYAVDLSAAGFSNILAVIPVAARNTSTATSCPKVSVRSFTNSAATLNIYEGNGNTTSILGVGLVLLGSSEAYVTNTTGITISLLLIGS